MKLCDSWNVSLYKDEIYIVTINVSKKGFYVGRLNDNEFYIENPYDNEEEILTIPKFLPNDKKFMTFEDMNKDQYQCVYISYSLQDLKTRKIILQSETN